MRTRSRGFTLIELMVVVAIVGVLSSIAIPTFRTLQHRSRQAERSVMLQRIHSGVEDFFARDNRFPGFAVANPNVSWLWLWDNPGNGWPPTGQKLPWRLANWGDHWSDLGIQIEGGLYYVYWGNGNHNGGTRSYWLVAAGDLDQDGVINTVQRLYSYTGPNLDRLPGTPPSSNCTFEWDLPQGAF